MANRGREKGSKEVSQERRVKAFEMRKAGLNYREIGKSLNISEAQSFRDVSSVMKVLSEQTLTEATSLREMETARLDKLQAALWPGAIGGNARTVEVLVKLMERRAKLWGLDMPIKIAPTDPTGVLMYDAASGLSDTERAERINQILQAAAIAAAVPTAEFEGFTSGDA